ncbi:hypothetical protein PIROE2DRAFT_10800 [Piromyces sp. E2]|nr:hypothetical protein PIROE2DRAFT_10800 [Piromyces sp. E2]|eukprot:OUM62821.1 hypothetical protein PIROE2DRAFT_10800 [Piromyces sp. E2]
MKSIIKFSYNKISLYCVTVTFLFIARIVHTHFIDDKDIKEGEIIDKELEAFKSLISGLETVKADDINTTEENENNNDDATIISDILKEIVNSNFNNIENSETNNNNIESNLGEGQKDNIVEPGSLENSNSTSNNITEGQKDNNIVEPGSQENSNNTSNNITEGQKNNNIVNAGSQENSNNASNNITEEQKDNNIVNAGSQENSNNASNNITEGQKDSNIVEPGLQENGNKIENEENKEQQNNENESKENNDSVNKSNETLNSNDDKTVESFNSKNNPEKPKKIQLVTEHQTFKGDKNSSNNHKNGIFEVNDKESDEDIKSLVKVIVESEGNKGDEALKKENDMLEKVKEAINNNKIKTHNAKLEKLAKAKEEDLTKGPKFSKPDEKHTKGESNDNIPGGIFKVEESFIYKCFFDQECTNFKGFTPDIASCNKTSRRCTNYCYVQKACLSNMDCSTSCGSWCLKDEDMVFGRCVMSFEEGDFCMESWRVCNEGLTCNTNTYVCEKSRIPITFTRIDSQESLLSIIIFLLVAVYLIKNSRTHNFVSFFSGYNLNEYCSNATQEYDPLPEYQRTEVLNSDEMDDLLAPPPDTDAPSNVEEAAAYCGYIDENNNNTVNCNCIPLQYNDRPVPYDPYNEPVIPYDVPPSGDPSVEDVSTINNVPSVDENGDINYYYYHYYYYLQQQQKLLLLSTTTTTTTTTTTISTTTTTTTTTISTTTTTTTTTISTTTTTTTTTISTTTTTTTTILLINFILIIIIILYKILSFLEYI